jgi:hypothetical protein
MQMSDIFTAVKSLAENDQSIANTDITTWVDMCINRINTMCQANIPLTIGQPTTYVPSFDPRFHEILVLFGVAKYRESDGDYQGAAYHMNVVNDMLIHMQRDMVLLPSTRKEPDIQQITATTGIFQYSLSMPFGSYFNVIEVYQNDTLVDPTAYTIDINGKTITFNGSISLVTNDKLTIVFEQNPALNHAPYTWWENTGW